MRIDIGPGFTGYDIFQGVLDRIENAVIANNGGRLNLNLGNGFRLTLYGDFSSSDQSDWAFHSLELNSQQVQVFRAIQFTSAVPYRIDFTDFFSLSPSAMETFITQGDNYFYVWREGLVSTGSGDDTIASSTADTIDAEEGTDTLLVETNHLGPMIDVVNNEFVTIHGRQTTVIQNVELLGLYNRIYELIFGSDANDVLTTDGSSFSAYYVLVGGDGQDTITGGLRGDVIKGGDASDLIDGLLGRDQLFGDDGDDVIYGRGGRDNIYGQDGRDTLFGGAKNDVLFGGRGADSLIGGQGNDNLFASLGNDTLEGNQGEDTLIGWDGNDLLIGGNGADRLEAGSGQDTLIGGNGRDYFVLGAGPDTLIFDLSDGRNYVSSFRLGHDQIQFGGFEGMPDLSHLTFDDLAFRQKGSNTILNIGNTRIEFRDRDVEDIAVADHFLFL